MNLLKSSKNIFFLVCVVFVIFSPAVRHPFLHWDDDVHCYANRSIRFLDRHHLKTIVTTDVNKTYIPLTIFSFAIEYHFFKDNPFFYHLDNILLHLGVVLMVYCLALRLGLSPNAAFWGALLFGIHPMHVESVAWVTQRKDVLYSLFYLLSCWNYVNFLRTQRIANYVWTLMFGILSVLAKPMALSLPLILCLFDWFVLGRINRQLLFNKIPLMFGIFPLAWITYAMNMRTIDLNITQAPLVWLWSLSFYVTKFLYPHDLLALYQLPSPVSLNNPAFIAAILISSVLLTLLIRFRHHRLLVFACLYFFLSIFFLLRFDDKQDLSLVADRFMYLPSFGICLLLGFWINRAMELGGKLQSVVFGGICLVYLILGVNAYNQTKLWGDEFALWSKVVKRFQSAAAYNHLGNYFLDHKDYAQALSHYDQSIALNPRYHKPYGNRGITHFKEGNYNAAIDDYTMAINLRPQEAAKAYNNRGYVRARLGELDAALADYNSAIAIDPQDVTSYLNRATIYKDRGDFNRALLDMRTAADVDPDDQNVKSNLEWLKKKLADR